MYSFLSHTHSEGIFEQLSILYLQLSSFFLHKHQLQICTYRFDNIACQCSEMLVQLIFCIQHFSTNAVNIYNSALRLTKCLQPPPPIINDSIFRGGTLVYALVKGQVTFPRWSVFLNT